MPDIWLNGNFIDESTASIPVRDTGLLHAAGVFTTLRADNSRVFRLAQHLQRLRESCNAMLIPLTLNDETLSSAVTELLKRNELDDARIRITVTRGQATNHPTDGLRLEPNVFISAAHLELYPQEFYERGMTVMLLDEQKLNPYDIQAGHKTLNYVSRLFAIREANRRGAGEALWFNVHNYLQSGSISNVFLVKSGRLITPPTPEEMRDKTLRDAMPYAKSAVLPGVTRGAILELARSSGMDVQLGAIDVNQLLEADEIFLSNSIMRIMPVCRIERQPISAERPGEVTLDLSAKLRDLCEERS
jgi:branched-chain amino acid aminotransferase